MLETAFDSPVNPAEWQGRPGRDREDTNCDRTRGSKVQTRRKRAIVRPARISCVEPDLRRRRDATAGPAFPSDGDERVLSRPRKCDSRLRLDSTDGGTNVGSK